MTAQVFVAPTEETIAQITAAGGATLDPRTGLQPASGFAFSEHPEAGLIVATLTVQAVVVYIQQNSQLLSDPAHYVGFWKNPKNALWYLDVATVSEYRQDALVRAARADQEAVYDLATGDEIWVTRSHRLTAAYEDYEDAGIASVAAASAWGSVVEISGPNTPEADQAEAAYREARARCHQLWARWGEIQNG